MDNTIQGDRKRNPQVSVVDQVARGLATSLRKSLNDAYGAPITNFYDDDDGDDWGFAIARAVLESDNIVFPKRDTPYRIKASHTIAVTDDITLHVQGQTLQFDPGASLIFSASTVSGSHTLMSNISRYDRQIELDTGQAANISANDIVVLSSSEQPSTYADTKYDVMRCSGTTGGDTVELENSTNFSWDTSEAGLGVTIFRAKRVVINQPIIHINSIEGSEGGGTTAILLVGLSDSFVYQPHIYGNTPFDPANNILRTGIAFYHCIGGGVVNRSAYAVSYPVGSFGGSRHIVEINASAHNCRHGILEMAGWASDCIVAGATGQANFSTLSAHASFRPKFHNIVVTDDEALPAPRSIGWTISNCDVATLDDTNATPEWSLVPTGGYEYLHDDSYYRMNELVLDAPNRTAKDVRIQYAHRVEINGSKCIGLRIGDGGAVDTLVIGAGNSFQGGSSTPSIADIDVSQLRCHGYENTAAYKDGSDVYHVDLYKTVADQVDQHLTARGPILRKVAADDYEVRFHMRAFAGGTTTICSTRLRLRVVLQHESAGVFSTLSQTFEIITIFGGSDYIDAKLIDTDGPHSGAGSPDVTMSVAWDVESFTDGYIKATITLGHDTGTAANAKYFLNYELESTETTT